MRAAVIVRDGADGAYDLREIPEPAIGPRELLVRVRAAALNRADIPRRAGRYDQPALRRDGVDLAGLEAAGWIVDLGSEVTRFRLGERVMGMCAGGFADYVAIDERIALPVPDELGWYEAAATPVAMMSEYDAIATRGRLRAGESLLIHGAGSAVGLMAVQIAALLGARPLMATVGSNHKAALVAKLGANVVADATVDFEAVVADHTDGGVDLVIDHVGAPYLEANLRAMAVGGRLVSVGRLGGNRGQLDLDVLARKNLQLIGTSFRTRTIEEYAAVATHAAHAVLPAIADGRMRPIVDRVFDFTELERAHQRMRANRHVGKIVLTLGGS